METNKGKIFEVWDIDSHHTWTIYEDGSISGFEGRIAIFNLYQPRVDQLKAVISLLKSDQSKQFHSAKIRGTNESSFRTGEWGQITSVEVHKPLGLECRPCFIVRYDDGVTDGIPVSDSRNYEIK